MRTVRIVGGAAYWQSGMTHLSANDVVNVGYECGDLFKLLYNEYEEVCIQHPADYFGVTEHKLAKNETLKAVIERLGLHTGVLEIHVRKPKYMTIRLNGAAGGNPSFWHKTMLVEVNKPFGELFREIFAEYNYVYLTMPGVHGEEVREHKLERDQCLLSVMTELDILRERAIDVWARN